MRTGTSYGNELPRIYELQGLLETRKLSNTYFQDFDNSIAADRQKLKFLEDIEDDLKDLDDAAWNFLKGEVVPFFQQKDCKRGWQQVFDRLNEAKGYNYLIKLGCQDVEFIPRSGKDGPKTPDLKGKLNSTLVLCEVKTINASNDEVERRKKKIAIVDYQLSLPEPFFKKLEDILKKAKGQMESCCSETGTRKIVYVVINPDDLLNIFAERYLEQLEEYKKNSPVQGIEIIFDTKPAYNCSAMV